MTITAPTEDDINNLAWTMIGESRPGDTNGMQAVGNTVLNRLAHGGYGSSITDVVMAPNQYAAWGKGDLAKSQNQHMVERHPIGSAEFNQAHAIAEQLLNGQLADNTNGSVEYRSSVLGTGWTGGRPAVNIGGNIYIQPSHPVPPRDIPVAPTVPPAAPYDATAPQIAYAGAANTNVGADGLSAIDRAMGTYPGANPNNALAIPLGGGVRAFSVNPNGTAVNPADQPGNLHPGPGLSGFEGSTGGINASGSGVGFGGVTGGAGGLSRTTPISAALGMFGGSAPSAPATPSAPFGGVNALANGYGSHSGAQRSNTSYVGPNGTTTPASAATVAMPPGARPASVGPAPSDISWGQSYAQGNAMRDADPFFGANGGAYGYAPTDVSGQLPQVGNAFSSRPSTTYTQQQMQVANPAYIKYIQAQNADPIGGGAGDFGSLMQNLNALNNNSANLRPSVAPPRTITVTRQVPVVRPAAPVAPPPPPPPPPAPIYSSWKPAGGQNGIGTYYDPNTGGWQDSNGGGAMQSGHSGHGSFGAGG